MPPKIASSVVKLAKGKIIPAIVIDVVRDLCSVRLSTRGSVLHGISYVGAPPRIGQRVYVDHKSGRPIVQGSSLEIQNDVNTLTQRMSTIEGSVSGVPPSAATDTKQQVSGVTFESGVDSYEGVTVIEVPEGTLSYNESTGTVTLIIPETISPLPASLGGTGVANGPLATLTLPNAATIFTGGGTIALGGFTLTISATGTAALLATANVFTNIQQITIPSATTKGLIIKGASAQSANLQEWQNSSGVVKALINASGGMALGTTSIPVYAFNNFSDFAGDLSQSTYYHTLIYPHYTPVNELTASHYATYTGMNVYDTDATGNLTGSFVGG